MCFLGLIVSSQAGVSVGYCVLAEVPFVKEGFMMLPPVSAAATKLKCL